MIVLIPFRYRRILVEHPLLPLYRDYTNLLLFAADAFLIAVLVFWGASLLVRPRRVRIGPPWLAIPLAGLVGISVLSAFTSVDRLISLYQAGWLVLVLGLYLYAVNEIDSLALLSLPLGLQVAVQSAVGIAQVLRQHSLGWTRLQELALDPAWNGVSVVVSAGARSLRAYGLSDHPNILGGSLALGLILLAAWTASAAEAGAGSVRRSLAAGAFSLGCAALLLTFSRSAWLALAGGFAALGLGLAAARRWTGLRIVAGLLGAALIVLLPFLLYSAPLHRDALEPGRLVRGGHAGKPVHQRAPAAHRPGRPAVCQPPADRRRPGRVPGRPARA